MTNLLGALPARQDISGEVGERGDNNQRRSGEVGERGDNNRHRSGEVEEAEEKAEATEEGIRCDTDEGESVSLLAGPLGVYGWGELDTVLLAAVASEAPLLLVGSHGCAKSFFLEKLAGELGLRFRFYNASLINYDDLVGIPMPSEDRKRLEYITTPTAIWDAEVVFLDEINRTKPELQNKLFPIIHEKRVQGTFLDKLRFRWAAMNPPVPDADFDEVTYLGAEPLDTALADRFAFIVEVPAWNELSHESRMSILHDRRRGSRPFPVPIDRLVGTCRQELDILREHPPEHVCAYLILLWDELRKVGVTLSTRRMSMLFENIMATHAAVSTLKHPTGEEDVADWNTSVWQALQHSLPQRAQGTAPELLKIRAAHLQAWTLMNQTRGSEEYLLLTISDSVERACEALKRRHTLSPETVGTALINFLSDTDDSAQRNARALALYTATQQRCVLAAPVLDAMANQLEGIFDALAFPEIPRCDYEYLAGLYEEIPDTLPPMELMLRHYDGNLGRRVYEKTQSVRDCKRAIKEFRDLLKRLTRVIDTGKKENNHE